MNRADLFVCQLFFWNKPLAVKAVVSFISPFVDIPIGVEGGEEFLRPTLVHIACRPHEDVVRDIQPFPKFYKCRCYFIAIILWSKSCLFSGFMYLCAVFINTGQKEHLIAFEAMIARQSICDNGTITVSGMRFVVDVVDRCGDVKCAHCISFLGLLFFVEKYIIRQPSCQGHCSNRGMWWHATQTKSSRYELIQTFYAKTLFEEF